MLLGKKRKSGKKIDELTIGEELTLTEKIEDKDLLLYLGLTNDANPLYIQHDYASQTPYKKPIVPPSMLTGIISSAISKYLPGPGSHILSQHFTFEKPVYHYETVTFFLQVSSICLESHQVNMAVTGIGEDGETVITGSVTVNPPFRTDPVKGEILENF